MKLIKPIGVVCLLLWGSLGYSQSKFYLSISKTDVSATGLNLFLGSDFKVFEFKYYDFDFEYQRRILGTINGIAGISVFNAGYSTNVISSSSKTDFKASYVAIPLMARWNPGNKNFFFFDAGVMPFYLLNAHLKENIDRFGSVRTVEGDITQYSNRFFFGFKLQMLIPMNRFYLGVFYMAPFKGQSSIKGLENHWGVNAKESTYLLSNGFSDYWMFGLKVGARIR
jgi:hypothetical protein